MIRLLVSLLSVLLIAGGCRYQPKNTTMFKLLGQREFDRVQLQVPVGSEGRPPIKLKYVDTNLFLTSGTLTPGRYLVVARTFEGHYSGREVHIEEGKTYYELPEKEVSLADQERNAPKLTATLSSAVMGREITEVGVLFISTDIIIRRTRVGEGGKLAVDGPGPGKYRVEIHALGSPPLSYVKEDIDLTRNIDLGLVSLR